MRAGFRTIMNARMRTALLLLLWALVLAALMTGVGSRLAAQQVGGRVVDSLETYRDELEKILSERISALIPSENFVLRVTVEGAKVRAPTAVTAEGIPELPGFRQTFRATTEGAQFMVTRVGVRIVVNEEISPSDVNYLRSLVPVLADFVPERGDRFDLQLITPEGVVESGDPEILPSDVLKRSEKELWDLSTRDWILFGLIGLVLLVLIVVLMRVFLMPKSEPVVAPSPPSPPEPDVAAEIAKEALALQEAREQSNKLDDLRKDVVRSLVGRPDLAQQLLRDWQDQPDKIVSLIHALGARIARQAVMPLLDAEGYKRMEETVRKEEPPATPQLIETMREANLYMITHELVQPEDIRSDPFAFLGELSQGQIAYLIKEEPVRIKAMVLSRLSPQETAMILEELPKEMQLEVAVQIGNFHSLPLDALEDVAFNLAEKARHVPDERTVDIEGPKTLVDLIGRTSSDTIRYLLRAVKAKDRRLSEEIDRRFFMFESIPLVPESVLPQVVRVLPSAVVVQAIQGADAELQRKVILAFPEQARSGMVTTLRAASFDAETVMAARQEVVARFQQLAEEGKIDLKEISDAWQEQAKAS